MVSRTVRLLSHGGRLIGFIGVVLTISVIVIVNVQWVVISYRYGPDWNVGILPLVFMLQILLASWVLWRVVRADANSLIRTFFLAFGGSFVVLYGWYFLLAGEGRELISVGNLLYLAAGLIMLCARLDAS